MDCTQESNQDGTSKQWFQQQPSSSVAASRINAVDSNFQTRVQNRSGIPGITSNLHARASTTGTAGHSRHIRLLWSDQTVFAACLSSRHPLHLRPRLPRSMIPRRPRSRTAGEEGWEGAHKDRFV